MPNQTLFFMIMILGMMTTLSSTSWLSAWLGLEINTMAFIPLLANQKNKLNNEAMLKYFLTQTLASAMILLPIILPTMNTHMWGPPQNMIITIALIMKMGAAPLHFWMPQIMEGLSWKTNIVLTTIQKIPPMMLLTTLNPLLFPLFASLSLITGAWGGYNQTSLRKLMAYSSISHMGGMILASMVSSTILMNYLIIYILMVITVMIVFTKTSLDNTTQLTQMKPIMFSIIMMNMLSMGGLPPFLGFFPKWILINALVFTSKPLMMVLIASSMVTLFFYLRITYTAFLLTIPMMIQTKTTTLTQILSSWSLWTIPLWLSLY